MIRRRGWSSSACSVSARGVRSRRILRRSSRESENSAVSEPEKKADATNNTANKLNWKASSITSSGTAVAMVQLEEPLHNALALRPESPAGRGRKCAPGVSRASPGPTSPGFKPAPSDCTLKVTLTHYGVMQRFLKCNHEQQLATKAAQFLFSPVRLNATDVPVCLRAYPGLGVDRPGPCPDVILPGAFLRITVGASAKNGTFHAKAARP